MPRAQVYRLALDYEQIDLLYTLVNIADHLGVKDPTLTECAELIAAALDVSRCGNCGNAPVIGVSMRCKRCYDYRRKYHQDPGADVSRRRAERRLQAV